MRVLLDLQFWILVCQAVTVGILFFYTRYTFKLLKTSQQQLTLQQEHFELANRPWICVGDLYFNKEPLPTRLNISFINQGKMPAISEISTDRISVTPLLGKTISAPIVG